MMMERYEERLQLAGRYILNALNATIAACERVCQMSREQDSERNSSMPVPSRLMCSNSHILSRKAMCLLYPLPLFFEKPPSHTYIRTYTHHHKIPILHLTSSSHGIHLTTIIISFPSSIHRQDSSPPRLFEVRFTFHPFVLPHTPTHTPSHPSEVAYPSHLTPLVQ